MLQIKLRGLVNMCIRNYHNLWSAVLHQAIADLKAPNQEIYEEAKKWWDWNNPDCQTVITFAGLNDEEKG